MIAALREIDAHSIALDLAKRAVPRHIDDRGISPGHDTAHVDTRLTASTRRTTRPTVSRGRSE